MSLVSFCFHFHDDAFIASVRNDQQSEIMNYKNLAIVIPLSILLIDFNPNWFTYHFSLCSQLSISLQRAEVAWCNFTAALLSFCVINIKTYMHIVVQEQQDRQASRPTIPRNWTTGNQFSIRTGFWFPYSPANSILTNTSTLKKLLPPPPRRKEQQLWLPLSDWAPQHMSKAEPTESFLD